MRTLASDLAPRWSIQSKFLDEAIALLTPIHLAVEAASEDQRLLIEKVYALLLAAEKELAG
jgi:hypothetical protein